ncbi:MAG: hypothetical protein K0B06_01860 [Brevefilum sp.]|nr:hypothetical protein [Brevefilum sp.]
MDALLQSILRGLITFRTGIYIVLGLGILLYLRKFLIGLREWQRSAFGLERKMAQRTLISASTGLILLLLLVLGEFLLVTIIEPRMPAQVSEISSVINPLAEPTATLLPDEVQVALPAGEDSVDQSDLVFECIEDVLEITYPANGDTISGTVEVIGSVNVDNFGSYKYEYSPTGNINWVTIAAGNQLKLDESIGFWYTSALTPGTYLLQLVPLDNVGEALTPCIVTVEVVVEE